jgi:hypothetical protein
MARIWLVFLWTSLAACRVLEANVCLKGQRRPWRGKLGTRVGRGGLVAATGLPMNTVGGYLKRDIDCCVIINKDLLPQSSIWFIKKP